MSATATGSSTTRRRSWGALVAAQRRLPLVQMLALAALFVYGASTIDGFSGGLSIRTMLVLAALLGLASIGQTICMLIGAIDLSVSGVIVFGAAATSVLCGTDGWSLVPALAVIVVFCAIGGATVGWVCHRFRVNPAITSLALSFIGLGLVLVWTGGLFTGQAPPLVQTLTRADGRSFGLPVSPVVVVWAAIAVILAFVLHRTVVGRRIYATGANPRAAELALIRTRRVWTSVFAFSVVCSGLVGVLLCGFAGADTGLGDPYLYTGLTAVMVGGTRFFGARGDYTHTVVGALILTVLSTILVGKGYSYGDEQIVYGVLLLVVITGYGRGPRLADRV